MRNQTKVQLQDSKEEVMFQIIQNLSESNNNIIISEDSAKIYFITETVSTDPISLTNLSYYVENEIDMDVEFQRDSNDHKGDTPQQIVADYCSGQFMGNITLYQSPNSNKKPLIDGRHRLSHLNNFIQGKLILENESASKFWTNYLKEIDKLLNKKGDVELNKLLNELLNPKMVKSKQKGIDGLVKSVKSVDYTKLPRLIQDAVAAKVKITAVDFTVNAKNQNLQSVNLTENDEKSMMVAWRKFYVMNNHKAKMTPDDNLWGMDSEYNEHSQRMASFQSLRNMFDIKDKDKKKEPSLDEKKKLNEMLVSIMSFLDKKFPWGGSSNKLVESVARKEHMKKMGDESINFFEMFNKAIEPNFKRMIARNHNFSLPEEFKGIKSGNLTNIRQFTLFLYLLHKNVQKNKDFVMYNNEEPTEMTKSVIDLGAKIIAVCVFNKNGELSLDKLSEYGLQEIYNQNISLFHKIAEFRKNQRMYNDLVPLYESLVKLSIEYTA